MKRTLLAMSLAIATMSAAVAADQTYKTIDGQAFSLRNVYRVDGGINGAFLRVTYVNGGDSLYADNGSVYNKIVQNNPQMVAISGAAQGLVDPNYAARILCQSGVSKIAIQGSSVIVEAADSCTMANQAIAKAK